MEISAVLVRLRFLLQAGYDAACWFVALQLAALLRYDFEWRRIDSVALVIGAFLVAACQIAIGRLMGLYIHRWRYGRLKNWRRPPCPAVSSR